jgi:hypothetical protein
MVPQSFFFASFFLFFVNFHLRSMSVAAFGRYRLATTTRSVFKNVDARSLATVKEGDRVPEVIFKARVRDEKIGGPNPFTWKDVKSSDLFGKKRAVVFALPGGWSEMSLLSIFLTFCFYFSFHTNLFFHSLAWIRKEIRRN